MQESTLNVNTTGKRLPLPFYYGQVVGTMVDTNHTGAVQAVIKGVTDDWKVEEQPWVYPQLGLGLEAVPQEGYWLLIRFLNGDIMQGLYYGVSATPSFLPREYTENYPFLAVANLGEHNFLYTHNRDTHVTKIDNPGNGSNITWGPNGALTVESDSYSSEEGAKSLPVLTEGTIDIFTCMPVGHGENGVTQGSEYLSVSHISAMTIEALRGNGQAEETQPKVDDVGDGLNMVDLYDADGNVVDTVPMEPCGPDGFAVRSGKVPTHILICCTEDTAYSSKLSDFMSDDAKSVPHYLVGLGGGTPDIIGTNDTKSKELKNNGFVQLVELGNDATFGKDMKISELRDKKANVDAIVVMFYGDGTLNQYQMDKLSEIRTSATYTFKLDGDLPVFAYRRSMLDLTYAKMMQYEES
jgi:hypothetical protein